jgi:hypothetical protein
MSDHTLCGRCWYYSEDASFEPKLKTDEMRLAYAGPFFKAWVPIVTERRTPASESDNVEQDGWITVYPPI